MNGTSSPLRWSQHQTLIRWSPHPSMQKSIYLHKPNSTPQRSNHPFHQRRLCRMMKSPDPHLGR